MTLTVISQVKFIPILDCENKYFAQTSNKSIAAHPVLAVNLYKAVTCGEWQFDRLVQLPQTRGIVKNNKQRHFVS